MADKVHGVAKWLSYNRYLALFAVLAIVGASVLGLMIGCASHTASVLDPAKQITQVQLQQEKATLESQLAKLAAAAESARQKALADITAEQSKVREFIAAEKAKIELMTQLAQTRSVEAQAEMETFATDANKKLTIAQEDLTRKDEKKAAVISVLMGAAASIANGGIPPDPAAAVGLGLQLVTGIVAAGYTGSRLDAARKDKVIADLKASPTPVSPTVPPGPNPTA